MSNDETNEILDILDEWHQEEKKERERQKEMAQKIAHIAHLRGRFWKKDLWVECFDPNDPEDRERGLKHHEASHIEMRLCAVVAELLHSDRLRTDTENYAAVREWFTTLEDKENRQCIEDETEEENTKYMMEGQALLSTLAAEVSEKGSLEKCIFSPNFEALHRWFVDGFNFPK